MVKENLKKRFKTDQIKWVDDLLKFDNDWRALKQESDNFRARRNAISEEINKAKKAGKSVEKLVKEAAEMPARIKLVDDEMAKAQEKVQYYLLRIPNMLHKSVPIGDDASKNVEIKKWGKPKKFNFELKNHAEWAEQHGLADFDQGTVVAGKG